MVVLPLLYFLEYLALKYEELELVGFNIEPDIPDERIMYSFDKMQLKRVFENILSNSIKANKEGTTIIASMKKAGDKIVIRLGDDGVGIPEAKRIRLNEELSGKTMTGEAVDQSSVKEDIGKGSHFGLYSAARRIQLYFGSEYGITLEPGAEKGTEVIIRIHYLTDETKEAGAEQA